MGKLKFPLRQASIQFFGRITRDPEVKFNDAGKPTCGFSVAVERWDGTKRVSSFFNCRAYGITAEKFKSVKGDPVYVTGEPFIDKWESKEGEKREGFKVFVNSVDTLEWPDDDRDEQPRGRAPQREAPTTAPAPEDDLPF
jgi:single-strand DNA-binding protein